MSNTQVQYAVTVTIRDAIATADDVQDLKRYIVVAMTNQSVVAEVEVELISSSFGPCFHCGNPSDDKVSIGGEQKSICAACASELLGVNL